eukprot:GHVL01032418.1.p1 GENE.GHVL01032418.1~~GHVL01032418.1.p1  ORF type:complete len:489 (+),score=74.34 GHVL01032418.1:119-1585(+)
MNTCSHPVKFGSLCALCYENLDDKNVIFEKLPGFVSKNGDLKVSREEAMELDKQHRSLLLNNKQLCVVLDLDNTLIHAFIGHQLLNPLLLKEYSIISIPKTFAMGEGGRAIRLDTQNEDKGSIPIPLQEGKVIYKVANFEDDHCGSRNLYVKLRPGVVSFLEDLSKHFKMYLYTAGAEGYALQLTRMLDPHGTYFGIDGNRVFARDRLDERDGRKCVKEISPHDDRMVVVVDDKPGVWVECENCIQVAYFEFEGYEPTGDINTADRDNQLSAISKILQVTHRAYFSAVDEFSRLAKHKRNIDDTISQSTVLPDVKIILKNFRRSVLKDVEVVVFGDSGFESTPLGMIAHPSFGCTFRNSVTCKTTHVMGYDWQKPPSVPLENHIKVVHLAWMEKAVFTWIRPPEDLFPLDNGVHMWCDGGVPTDYESLQLDELIGSPSQHEQAWISREDNSLLRECLHNSVTQFSEEDPVGEDDDDTAMMIEEALLDN